MKDKIELLTDKTSSIQYPNNIVFGNRVHIRCVQGAEIIIFDDVKIDDDVRIVATNGAKLILNKNVKIGKGTMINLGWEKIEIGENTSTYMNVLIYTSEHIMGSENFRTSYKHEPVKIGANCLLGSGCVIKPGSYVPDHTKVNHNEVWQ